MAGRISVRIETQNPELSKVILKVLHSVQGFSVDLIHADEGIDLLIYDIGMDFEKDFARVQFFMDKNKNARVFLTSAHPEQEVLVQAIRIGAKEFFSQPLDIDELRNAFKRLDITTHRRLGEVCTVMGCKGGVGTTCIAVNLAVALKHMRPDASLALVDMNLMFGEIPLFLNFKPKYTWAEVAKHINRMDDVFLNENLFEHSTGVHVLPSPSMWKSTDEATPPIFMRILGHMRRLFDYIVIDCGHTFSEMNMKTLENSDRVFLVTLLNLPCLSNTSKVLSSFDTWGYPEHKNTHVIINRYIPGSEISLQACEKSINKKVFMTMPNDYALTMMAINQGQSLYEVDGKSPLTKSFNDFAQHLMPPDPVHTHKEGVLKKMPLLKSIFRGHK